jgi:hypothetical protein
MKPKPGARLLVPKTRNLILALVAGALSWQALAQNDAGAMNNPPAIALTPAVIAVRAKAGQSFSQDLTLWNNTADTLRFEMQAEDIVVRDGKREFVSAGDLEGGIARYAVFTDTDFVVVPGTSYTTRVTVRIPPNATPRAIACIFMGKTPLATRNSVAMTASLGSLVTFTLADDFKVESQPMRISVDTDAGTVTFRQRVTNTGSDPVVPKGALAIMNTKGAVIARLPVAGQRLLPGESQEFTAERPTLPKAGRYKALFLLQHELTVFSNAGDFTIE